MDCRQPIPGWLAVIAGVLLSAPVYAVSGNKPWQVTDLVQDGVSLCDGGGAWSYQVTWKPIVYENQPWAKYKLRANGCQGITYACTATSCTAVLSRCSTRLSSSWTGVTADIGKSVSGVRVGGIVRPPSCK